MPRAPAHRGRHGWPLGLSGELAAEYIGLSLNTFLRLVDVEDAPPALWLSPGRKVWHRRALDAWLDRRAGLAPCSAEAWLEAADAQDDPALRPSRHLQG